MGTDLFDISAHQQCTVVERIHSQNDIREHDQFQMRKMWLQVTSVDVGKQERCVTAGFDRTCRIWKVPEESQLVFRASGLATDSVRCGP
jgi:hypothetical protein